MNNKFLSLPHEKPKLKLTWWAFSFGLVVLAGGPILGIFAAVVMPYLSKHLPEKTAQNIGFGWLFFILVFLITSLILSITSYKKGERSWVMWLGLIPSILGVLFLILMILGEFIFPH